MKFQITCVACAAALLLGTATRREAAVAQDTLPPPDLGSADASELPADQPEPAIKPNEPDLSRPDLSGPDEQLGEQLADVPPAHLGVTFDPRFRDAAVVRSVTPDSPAEQARLQEGDAIEAINGRDVSSYEDVIAAIDTMRPGDVIDIDFSRRITGRTQAVLGEDAGSGRRTVGYGAGRFESQSAQAMPPDRERLPPGDANTQLRGDDSQYSARTPLPRQADPSERTRREDSQARDEADDRDDGRLLRNRGILPWRRN